MSLSIPSVPARPLFPASSASTIDHSRPSLFDLLAQEQLRDLFHPVVRYVLSYFAQRYPRYLLRILNHHEEFFALLLLLLERHHLKRHNASISEHFYGLRSTPTGTIPTPRLRSLDSPKRINLSRKQRWALLVFLVGLPYIRARAQDYYERLGGGGDIEDGQPRGVALTTAQRGYRVLYPYVSLGLDLTFLGYDIAYLFEKTNSYRPWHRWLGLRIARKERIDITDDTSSIMSKLPPLLPPLLLLLKLSQWWYSPSSPRAHPALASNRNTTATTHAAILPPRPLPILPSSDLLLPAPPFTPPAESKTNDEAADPTRAVSPAQGEGSADYQIGKQEYGKCPLCKKKWQNPAVLPSGWVVCWRCGWDAVEADEEEEEEEDGEEQQEKQSHSEIEGGSAAEVTDREGGPEEVVKKTRGPRRKGRCPITGVYVAPGQLRRVLV